MQKCLIVEKNQKDLYKIIKLSYDDGGRAVPLPHSLSVSVSVSLSLLRSLSLPLPLPLLYDFHLNIRIGETYASLQVSFHKRTINYGALCRT